MSLASVYLTSVQQRFLTYKELGGKTISRLNAEQLHWQPEGEPNSITHIVKHLRGNMLSRWTDFLTTDGEKPNRHRDEEFENDTLSKEAIQALWEEGWKCLMDTLASLTPEDLEKTVLIRNEPHSVVDAINRQLAHIPYHVGQIVYLGKMILKDQWDSLSIPKGQSEAFNKAKFGSR
ncbi:uncharacterized protein DUF1572 [Chitinophaga dinghuensis]|uniref:Uncharacterized protein DUF1572 n=1 Tax=Chitinophaga dinghuensis TaxID=1539050 RepID=A0A327W069_9BACT|nr:DUF1572 family protein [Chitinophaga dinghuensis]RAJ81790.1 uncharacterized protein DUF1572 [Chitinophaga dinghuensis]